jgi:hypothetical protein
MELTGIVAAQARDAAPAEHTGVLITESLKAEGGIKGNASAGADITEAAGREPARN